MARLPALAGLVVAFCLALVATPAGADDVAEVCDRVNTVTNTCAVLQDKTFFPATPTFDIGGLVLRVTAGHTITVAASVTSPGQLTLKVGGAVLEPGSSIVVHPDAAGNGGGFALTALQGITIQQQGARSATIDASAGTKGGHVTLTAGGDVVVNGLVRSAGTPGWGGDVAITAGGAITLAGSTVIQVPGGTAGPGGTVTVIGTGPVLLDSAIDASGGGGGGALDLESTADLSTTAAATLLVNGPGSGGNVVFNVNGSLAVAGRMDLSGQLSGTSGGDGGEVDMNVDHDITLGAPIDLSATPPDGTGGTADLEAGGALTQAAAAPILAGAGNGVFSGGGSVTLTAGTDLVSGLVDVSGGGFGGGSIDIEALGRTTIAGELNADGDDAGDLTLIGGTVLLQANAHSGAQPDGLSGLVSVQGCEIDVPAGAVLAAEGSASGALLQASGPMTIGGTITSTDGPNLFQYRDTPPVFLPGAVIVPPSTPVHDPALPPCAAPPTTTTTLPASSTTVTTTSTSTTSTGLVPTTTSPPPSSTTSSVSTSSTSSTSTSSVTTSSLAASTTTSSSVTTSSSATTTTSSTTTSTRAECTSGNLGGCTQGDQCTVVSCPAGVCVYDPKTGTDGVTCRLEMLDADMTAAGSAALGGATRAATLMGKVGRARTLVEASRSLSGRRRTRKLRSAGKQMTTFAKAVAHAETRGKIAGPLANQLLVLAADASTRLQQLQAP